MPDKRQVKPVGRAVDGTRSAPPLQGIGRVESDVDFASSVGVRLLPDNYIGAESRPRDRAQRRSECYQRRRRGVPTMMQPPGTGSILKLSWSS